MGAEVAKVEGFSTGSGAEDQPGWLTSAFGYAVKGLGTIAEKTASLAYDFFKANPVVTLVGADLLLTGGAITQKLAVAAAATVAGTSVDLTEAAAYSIWDSLPSWSDLNPF